MSEYYDPDQDAQPQSPLLQVVRPRATPSPSPEPLVTPKPLGPPAARHPRYCSPRKNRKPSRRRRNQPSQGDYVLIRAMDPSRLDIARRAGQEALPFNPESDSNPPTDTGSESDDDDMEDQSSTSEVLQPKATAVQPESSSGHTADLQAMAQRVLETQHDRPRHPPTLQRDSVIDLEGDSQTRSARSQRDTFSASYNRGEDTAPNNGHRLSAPTLTVPNNFHGAFANGFPTRPRAPSPHLGQLSIPQAQRTGSPSPILPAIQPGTPLTAGSPDQERHLPPISAVLEQQERESNSLAAHRPSIASSAHSPTSNPRQLSISSARSPGTAFPPLSAVSPQSANGEGDFFLRTSSSALFGTHRRQSQASETTSPYSSTTLSASESYYSPGGISPGTQPAPIEPNVSRLNIDSALAAQRTLPCPPGLGALPHIPHIPPHGHGEYKCDHPGCKAAPFQTQYLLNSHANVHSSSRPHYCPVPGCARGESGKGFKRKNEMIRHGLVHSSPGYICPFCPEREHRYPRPDNLQR